MIVQKITLNGFKSFAKRTEIDLNFPIVALVGPNGSGKSNVADGIRWVLGEQGTKNLRASKQEDVIFAGSATKQPKGMAEVKLQFDNGTQFFDVPWAELELGRVLYRDGQGEYLMNNNKVLHRELAEVLAKSGLGSFDLTVIGQGEIDQILIMGSKEIQSLLEDASGVKPFYMKKARIVNNLRGTSENTKRLQDILGELEPRLQILKKESKQAQDYLEIKENLAIKQKAWYQLQLQKIDQDIASLSKTSTLFDAKRSEIHAQIEAKEAETKVLSSALINRQGDLQNISRRIESLQDELNEYWQEQAGIQAKLELNRSQLAPINTDKGGDSATLVKQEDELGAELKALEKQIVTGESQEEHVKEQLQKVMLNYQKTIDQLNEQSQKQSAGAGRALVKSKFGEVRSLYDKLSEKLFGKSLPLQELKRAFEIGFLIFVPFLIIDMAVASILMSMGMMMLPPVIISLPFKLIFFVLVDGWRLVAGSLVESFHHGAGT